MVSESDIERYAREEVEPQRGVDTRRCASKVARPERGGLGGPTSIGEGNECQRGRWALKRVDCEISHRLGRRTKHSLQGCGNLSLIDAFYLEAKPERESPKRTVSASGGLGLLH